MKIRKLTNVSDTELGVKLEGGNTVFLKPHDMIENINIEDSDSLSEFSRIEYDLNEVPVRESRQKLYDCKGA